MNTTDKYITIPASELSGREARAFPDGKQVKNPDYIPTAADIAEQKEREFCAKLVLAGGREWEKEGLKRIYFNDQFIGDECVTVYYDCVARAWSNADHGAAILEGIES